MEQRIRIGMDLGKKTRHKQVRIDVEGKPRRARTVRTTAASLDEMLAGVNPAQTDVVLEPTGMVWLAISAFLLFRGCRVFRVDTWSAAQFRKFLKKHVKSDITDSEALGRMPAAAEDKLVALTMPQASLFSLERLVRQRKQFVDDATRTKLRVEAAADTYIPGLFDALGKDPLTAGKRVLLRHFMDPQRIVDAGVDGMRKVLREHKRRVSTSILEQVYTTACDANSIWQPLRDAACCPVDFRVAQEMIRRYLDLLEDFERHIKALHTSITAIAPTVDGYDAVLSSPGIGEVIGPGLLANTGDVRRFPNGDNYVSYCGLAPGKNQTGERDRRSQKITKAGKPILRKYYYLAAEKARRIDPELAAFYQRKIDEGKHHETVVTAIAAKLARRVYAILKRSIAGEDAGYRICGPNNELLTPREAAAFVKEHFPSKAARKRAQAASKETKKRLQARHEKAAAKRRRTGRTAGAEKHYALRPSPATHASKDSTGEGLTPVRN